MDQLRYKRILLGLLLCVGLFVFPYWFVMLVALVIAIIIPYYIEFIVLVAFEEMLYAGAGIGHVSVVIPVVLLLGFILLEASRSLIRERILRI